MGLGNLMNGMAILLLQDGGSFWMPPQSSTTAAEVDWLFFFIFYLSIFFFAIIVSLTVLFAIRYRRRPGREDPDEMVHHNLALEVTWSIIPLILVIAIFWAGFKAYMNMATPPPNSYEIRVTGQKWQWLFTYPNGWVDGELHAPAGIPVKLVMTSEDVIHSLYVPDFRMKKDVVPGRYTTTWFEAPEVGEHNLFCAEYCGTEHSGMITRVIIHEPADYLTWLENAASFYEEMPPAEAGAEMISRFGCAQCHSVEGKAGTGPPLDNLFGREELLKGDKTVMVDENYIRRSILDPNVELVRGYQGVMPTFQGRIKDQEIDWVIAYLKQISEHYEEPLLMPIEELDETAVQGETVEPATEEQPDVEPDGPPSAESESSAEADQA